MNDSVQTVDNSVQTVNDSVQTVDNSVQTVNDTGKEKKDYNTVPIHLSLA